MNADKIYLVGFMGAGKTTIARALGRRLGWRAEDIDERIEARERKAVASIFAQQGEAHFRQLERLTLGELLAERHIVVATGGGTFVEADNRALMLADGAVAWLDLPLERVFERVPADGRRPLASDRPQMELLFARRQLAYAQAHIRVDASRPPMEVVERLLEWLEYLMKYLILSDIHANLEALEATLAAAGDYDSTLVLGDLVGYGADPNAVVDRVRSLRSATFIRGNHDKVGSGLESVKSFNHLARQAIEWTSAMLTAENRDWLAALPQGPTVIDDTVEICHGAPFDEDLYIVDDLDARHAFRAMQRPLCVYGHTHVPAAFRFAGDLVAIGPPRGERFELTLEPEAQYLVNCGAVGQPRDGDQRAAFGLLDTSDRTLAVVRIPYDVATAQNKILAAGLPDVLARRLGVGR